MSTQIYGCSDDLIEARGDVSGEHGCYGTGDQDQGVLVICSDGTLLDVKFGKAGEAMWGVRLVRRGALLDRIEQCDDPDADIYSDVAHFRDGLKWCYCANNWERMR